jgi:hypothetical protein
LKLVPYRIVLSVDHFPELKYTPEVLKRRLLSSPECSVVHLFESPLDIAEPLFLICVAP